jgi:hypothetical protein
VKLLDLIELHQEKHENAVLWIMRAGPHAGRTSLVSVPNAFAVEIKNPKLSKYKLEQMISEYRQMGCLNPQGAHHIINGEQFLPLMVDMDEYGIFSAHCDKADQLHG